MRKPAGGNRRIAWLKADLTRHTEHTRAGTTAGAENCREAKACHGMENRPKTISWASARRDGNHGTAGG